MSNSFDNPKPITGILPHVDDYRQKSLSKDLEEQHTLLSDAPSSEPIWPKNRRGITNTNLVAVVLFFFTIVIGSLAWLSVSAGPQTDKRPKYSKTYTDCGTNYSTAIEAGCIFDIVAPQWVPPECYNATISKGHAAKVSRPMFFRWPNLTEPLSDDPLEISQYETVWTFDEFHKTHCIYILELAALAAGKAFSGHQDVHLNSISGNPRHTKHCTDMLSSNVTSPGPTEIRRPGGILRCNVLPNR